MKKLFVLMIMVFATFSIAQDLAAVKAQIEKNNEKMRQAMLNNNTKSLLPMYTKDAYSLSSYEPMLKGYDAIEKIYEKNSAMKNTFNKVKFTTIDVFGENKYFTEIGTYEIDMKNEQMPNGMKDVGKYVTIWEKQDDGTLKIKTEIWNTDSNPWQEMQKQQGKKEVKSDKATSKESTK